MKKCIFVSIIFMLILSSCSNVYKEITISNIEQYEDLWTLPERRVDETSLLFPKEIAEEQCVTFHGKHDTYRLLGTGWQVILEMQYDDSAFIAKTERLKKLCENSPVCGISEHFDKPTYASAWNWNSCFEYAVVDEQEKTVCYLYLQLIEPDDLIIDKNYLPKDYEMLSDSSEHYFVYE